MKPQSPHLRKARRRTVLQPNAEKVSEKTAPEGGSGVKKVSKGGPGAKPVEAEVTRNNESGSNEYGGLSPQNENFVSTATVNYLAQRVEAWLRIGYPVHLIGPTGCGKTSLAMHIAKNIGRPIVWINGDEAVTTKDLVGGYAQVKKETLIDNFVHNVSKKTEVTTPEWVDNPLTSACRHGYTLIYNEFSRTRPVANNVLLSIFEEGILELPTKNGQERYVKVHPEFRAIMTSNSVEYSGVHRPQDALLDRIISIHMDYYDFDTEMSIVRKHAGISEEAARKIVSIVRKVRERMDLAHKPGTRACIMVGKALKNLGGENEIPLEQLLMDVIAAKASSYQDLLKKQKFVREGIAEMENTG